jgi:DNA modification methylase
MTKPGSARAADAASGHELPLSSQRPHRLAITYCRIDELRPNPANPRRHSKAQLHRLAQMIKAFGFRAPILRDADGMIIAGHARWQAALRAGLTEVPTILVQDLTKAEIKAFAIADNRIAELASWDDAVLAQQFLELSQINPALSLELTGFDMGEIDLRVESLDRPAPKRPDPADAIPPGTGPAVTATGDLWLLSQNRILCADARDTASYTALLGAKRAAAVFTNPSYNVRIHGHASDLGPIHHRDLAMVSGALSDSQFGEFLTTTLGNLTRHATASAFLYVCMDWHRVWQALGAARSTGCELVDICVWVKQTAGMGSLYRSQHELVLVLKHGRGGHQLGRHRRNRSNVWQYHSANDFGRSEAGEGNLLHHHPTTKPIAMIADAIVDCTKRGDIVLDAFLGIGSTLIAAERTRRKCYGIEIDPLYVDAAVRRWQAWTRGTARHAATGRSFDDVAQSREAGP